jgi:hypothetical protein
MLSFTTHADCPCSSCNRTAPYGFFLTSDPRPGTEQFFCSGCAQREFTHRELDGAIEAHRQQCFDLAEESQGDGEILGEIKDDHHRDMVIAGWLDYAIAE